MSTKRGAEDAIEVPAKRARNEDPGDPVPVCPPLDSDVLVRIFGFLDASCYRKVLPTSNGGPLARLRHGLAYASSMSSAASVSPDWRLAMQKYCKIRAPRVDTAWPGPGVGIPGCQPVPMTDETVQNILLNAGRKPPAGILKYDRWIKRYLEPRSDEVEGAVRALLYNRIRSGRLLEKKRVHHAELFFWRTLLLEPGVLGVLWLRGNMAVGVRAYRDTGDTWWHALPCTLATRQWVPIADEAHLQTLTDNIIQWTRTLGDQLYNVCELLVGWIEQKEKKNNTPANTRFDPWPVLKTIVIKGVSHSAHVSLGNEDRRRAYCHALITTNVALTLVLHQQYALATNLIHSLEVRRDIIEVALFHYVPSEYWRIGYIPLWLHDTLQRLGGTAQSPFTSSVYADAFWDHLSFDSRDWTSNRTATTRAQSFMQIAHLVVRGLPFSKNFVGTAMTMHDSRCLRPLPALALPALFARYAESSPKFVEWLKRTLYIQRIGTAQDRQQQMQAFDLLWSHSQVFHTHIPIEHQLLLAPADEVRACIVAEEITPHAIWTAFKEISDGRTLFGLSHWDFVNRIRWLCLEAMPDTTFNTSGDTLRDCVRMSMGNAMRNGDEWTCVLMLIMMAPLFPDFGAPRVTDHMHQHWLSSLAFLDAFARAPPNYYAQWLPIDTPEARAYIVKTIILNGICFELNRPIYNQRDPKTDCAATTDTCLYCNIFHREDNRFRESAHWITREMTGVDNVDDISSSILMNPTVYRQELEARKASGSDVIMIDE